ncbi:MAG: hypothetical protein IH607_04915 [Firmicutes bacterium]|nr:hypothetical protein [Bacillota bacterium]
MVTVTAIGSDEDTLFAILDIVRDGMAEVYTKAVDFIGDHQLTEIRSQTYTVNDGSLAERQEMVREQLAQTEQQLNDKQDELEALTKAAGALTIEPVWRTVAKELVKTALYTLVGAGIVMILLLGLYYIVSDRVLDADKLQYTARLDILGKIAAGKAKRIRWMDRLAAAVGGVRLQSGRRDDLLALTAQSIRSTVASGGFAQGSIALAGNMAPEELAEIAAALNESLTDDKLVFTAAGDPMQDIASVEKIHASVMAVIIVRQNASRCSDTVRQAARIAAWGKPVLGAVLLDADTV